MMKKTYTYPDLKDVYVSGIDVTSLTSDEQNILYHQAKYCQAMIDADTDTMGELVSNDEAPAA